MEAQVVKFSAFRVRLRGKHGERWLAGVALWGQCQDKAGPRLLAVPVRRWNKFNVHCTSENSLRHLKRQQP